ncbi:alcohol sulfotransferase-like [Ostrea edulis]|uniref:alcohol sulfotransferase-like n=1 Tax=Ostrea edulis TaxID=37623 RepID=UPI0024AFE353|nr:alcohol sulfotransferase-like [Ostrea edulis]
MLRLNGLNLPPFLPLKADASKRVSEIENLLLRRDDILICSLPKSGNQWLNEIVPRLLHSTLDSSHRMTNTFLEFMPDLLKLQYMASPRVMTSHLPYRCLPKENPGKIIHIIRNPKDVVVSAFYHFTKDPVIKDYICHEWCGFLDDFLCGDYVYGSWFDREREWEQAALANPGNILIVYYEELKTNGMETLKRISNFIGVSPDMNFLQAVYDICTIEEVKKRRNDPEEPWTIGNHTLLSPRMRSSFTFLTKG